MPRIRGTMQLALTPRTIQRKQLKHPCMPPRRKASFYKAPSEKLYATSLVSCHYGTGPLFGVRTRTTLRSSDHSSDETSEVRDEPMRLRVSCDASQDVHRELLLYADRSAVQHLLLQGRRSIRKRVLLYRYSGEETGNANINQLIKCTASRRRKYDGTSECDEDINQTKIPQP